MRAATPSTELQMQGDDQLMPAAAARLAAARRAIARRQEVEGLAAAEVSVLAELFPYALDGVQLEAFSHHAQGKDVVCCMPTGSGKTAVGEFAVWRALLRGRRVFYTTPLKALSGQKRREFVDVFGKDAVGLVTGDHCIMPSAPIVVMTTEILRNLFYPDATLGGQRASLDLLEAVVLDELHWINDKSRGTTWEETIMYCPCEVRIVGLSATVGGEPQVFCDWVASVHGRKGGCALVAASARPVPLHFYLMGDGSFGRSRLFQLMDAGASGPMGVADPGRPTPGPRAPLPLHPRLRESLQKVKVDPSIAATPARPLLRFERERLELSRMLRRLQRLRWLPAITFVLSRKGCDAQVVYVAELARLPGWQPLLSGQERERLEACLEAFERVHPEVTLLGAERAAILEGAAAHHAGQMPAQRVLIERLFELRLVKLVFATETLAAGINMPAKCVVVSSYSKTDGQGLRLLGSSELLQMSGRAGRRGLDTLGHAVLNLTTSTSEAAHWAVNTLSAGPEALCSNFSPSYEMLCALLRQHSLPEVEQIFSQSFGAFLNRQGPLGSDSEPPELDVADIQDDARQLREIRSIIHRAGVPEQAIEEYLKLCKHEEAQAKVSLKMESRLFGHSDDDLLTDEFADIPPLDDILPPVEEPSAVSSAKEPSAVEKHWVHSLPVRDELVSAVKRRRSLRRSCQRWAKYCEALGPEGACSWPAFLRYGAVLEEVGFIGAADAAGRVGVTPGGQAAGRITRGANALWLGSALLPRPLGSDVVGSFGLGPAALAALVAAMTTEVRNASGGGFGGKADAADAPCDLLPEELQPAIAWLDKERWRLAEIQWSHGVNEPLPLAMDALIIAYNWASNYDWEAATTDARVRGLADGDLYRRLRRTLEVLRGLELAADGLDVEGLQDWKERVAGASAAVDRSPLSDNAAIEDGECELELLL